MSTTTKLAFFIFIIFSDVHNLPLETLPGRLSPTAMRFHSHCLHHLKTPVPQFPFFSLLCLSCKCPSSSAKPIFYLFSWKCLSATLVHCFINYTEVHFQILPVDWFSTLSLLQKLSSLLYAKKRKRKAFPLILFPLNRKPSIVSPSSMDTLKVKTVPACSNSSPLTHHFTPWYAR